MKRVLATAVLTAALVAGATVAEAAIKKGTFTGKTTASDPVGLKVDKSGKVYAFYSPSGENRIQTPGDVKFKVSSKGAWKIKARNKQTGLAWDAAAKFKAKGTQATGTLVIRSTFNEQNEQDPNGSIKCESEKLTFSLKRGGAAG
jgi:hypothetical protein